MVNGLTLEWWLLRVQLSSRFLVKFFYVLQKAEFSLSLIISLFSTAVRNWSSGKGSGLEVLTLVSSFVVLLASVCSYIRRPYMS